MSNFGSILKGIFYIVLIGLVLLLAWTVYDYYKAFQSSLSNLGNTAGNFAYSFGSALKNALDPSKETFFLWRLPVFDKTLPSGQDIGNKVRGWFGMPTGAPGGSSNPMDQNTTGEQSVLLEPNFPPSITAQVTPQLAQPDPQQYVATQNTGTDGTGQNTPVDNYFPIVIGGNT
jgi:hypothetical protein